MKQLYHKTTPRKTNSKHFYENRRTQNKNPVTNHECFVDTHKKYSIQTTNQTK